MMIYGYARVSTATQGRDGNSLEEQVSSLEKYGCQEIITEAFTGKTMERPKFNSLFNRLQRDDTLVVWQAGQIRPNRHRGRTDCQRAIRQRR